ncbi:MAG: ATP-binding cassette domain-containing protein [Anaerotignum sp.]
MIEMKHITKKYGDFTVFSDFSMEIPDGEVLCLMGKSGRGGKTTLLRMLMELEQPDAGSINGLEGKKISVVFQEDRSCSRALPSVRIYIVSAMVLCSRSA